jgi:tetratricopeptide (TPR) repeat protein
MKKPDLYTCCFAGLFLLGAALRFAGLTRGESDFVLPEHNKSGLRTSFYHFHPDEEYLIRAALAPVDLLKPPYTVYGLLPNYILRGTLLGLGMADADLSVETEASQVYFISRFLAAALSCGTLLWTWLLGIRYCTRGATLFAMAVVAFAPGAVQQAHFYIADGFFSLLSLMGMWAILRAVETGQRRWYLLSGLLIGALGSARFNGLALGLVLMIGHITREVRWRNHLRKLLAGDLWIAGAVALVLFLSLHPFLLTNAEVIGKDEGTGDFATALRFAQGEILQPWTLKDVHTVLLWDHWFDLWPRIATWPLTLTFIVATFYATWKRQPWSLLALVWCAIYFIPIGLMPVKAVRHLVPLLPFMGILAGILFSDISRHHRWLALASAFFLAGHIAFLGLGFSQVYTNEDSRIQAARWINSNIPKGSRIGLETGAFSLHRLIDNQLHPHVWLDISRLFYLAPYQLCGTQVDHLRDRALSAEYLVIIDSNRAAQFRAVPELFPAIAAFYQKLIEGRLGFELVQRFKVYPELAGIKRNDDGAMPDFLGYDHPAVMIFQRGDQESADRAFDNWKQEIQSSPHCPDRELARAASALQDARISEARLQAERLARRHSHTLLAQLIRAEAARLLDREEDLRAALEQAVPKNVTGLMNHVNHDEIIHLVPASLAHAASVLELSDLAVTIIDIAVIHGPLLSPQHAKQMAGSYLNVANILLQNGDREAFLHVVYLAMQISPDSTLLNILASAAIKRMDLDLAATLWRQSLEIEYRQARVHASLGATLLRLDSPRAEDALSHLQRAIELDSELAPELQPLIAEVLPRGFGTSE